jgi:CHAT domain-containing protein
MDFSKTDLVVLSACETGLVGFGGKSDEFIGLPGGFIRAGAKNVVSSLWVVDDETTSLLMQKFYNYIIKQGFSHARALREAQLEIQKQRKWKNPFFWGSFRLLGGY